MHQEFGMSLHGVRTNTASATPPWVKKEIAASDRRFLADRVDSWASKLNWSATAQYLCTELRHLEQEAQKHTDFPYRYSVWQSREHDPIKQVILYARRKEPIPAFMLGSGTPADKMSLHNSRHEHEEPAQLVISQANNGTIAVIGYPHSSSNGKLQDSEPLLLEIFESSERILTNRGKKKIRKAVALFLEMHRISAFGNKHRLTDRLHWKKLARARTRYEQIVPDPKAKRLERLRMDFSFGTAFAAATLVLGMQLSVNLFTRTEEVLSLSDLAPPLAVLSVANVFLYLIIRKASRL